MYFAVFMAALCWGGVSPVIGADLDWTEKTELNLEVSPLDVAASSDGVWLFVLTPGQLLVYTAPENKLLEKIPVDVQFDRLAHSPKDNTLVLSSSSGKSLKFIELQLVHDFDISGLPSKGPENAMVTVVVFGDYQWPYCARLEPALQQVLEKYPQDVKLVHKNFPLRSHKFAVNAAKAALAAHRQGRFWNYHRKLLENCRELNDATFKGLATDLGLSLERFNRDVHEASINQLIYRDVKEARDANIRGIPAVFINGRLLKNNSIPGFQQMIDAELQKRKSR
jgi:hypothetical protein